MRKLVNGVEFEDRDDLIVENSITKHALVCELTIFVDVVVAASLVKLALIESGQWVAFARLHLVRPPLLNLLVVPDVQTVPNAEVDDWVSLRHGCHGFEWQ